MFQGKPRRKPGQVRVTFLLLPFKKKFPKMFSFHFGGMSLSLISSETLAKLAEFL